MRDNRDYISLLDCSLLNEESYKSRGRAHELGASHRSFRRVWCVFMRNTTEAQSFLKNSDIPSQLFIAPFSTNHLSNRPRLRLLVIIIVIIINILSLISLSSCPGCFGTRQRFSCSKFHYPSRALRLSSYLPETTQRPSSTTPTTTFFHQPQ